MPFDLTRDPDVADCYARALFWMTALITFNYTFNYMHYAINSDMCGLVYTQWAGCSTHSAGLNHLVQGLKAQAECKWSLRLERKMASAAIYNDTLTH